MPSIHSNIFATSGSKARSCPTGRCRNRAGRPLSQFRIAAGRAPADPRFTELAAALTEASPQFQDWWAEYPVRYFRPAAIAINHREAGLIRLAMFQLRLVDQPRLTMVVQVPASDTCRERVASLLSEPHR